MKTNFLKFAGFIFCLLLICVSFFAYEKPALSANGDFTLAWSSDSYVPLDYLGKAMPTRNSKITVWVMPTKKLTSNPDFLNYRWFLDGDIMGWANGKGKSVFTFASDKWSGQKHEIEVQILDSSEKSVFSGKISIQIVSPEIILKTKDNQPVGENYSVKNGQILNLIAQPLFFNIRSISGAIFKWEVDGIKLNLADNDPDKLDLTIPKTELESSLKKLININISNPNNEFERSNKDLTLEIN